MRILIVPDFLGWAFGAIAREIARWNPQYDCRIISLSYIRKFPERFSGASKGFDVIHYLVPGGLEQIRSILGDDSAYVASIHHVTEWEKVKDVALSDALMVESTEWADYVERQGIERSKMVLVPLGVDTDRFRPVEPSVKARARKRLCIPDGAFVIGSFGRQARDLSGRKGADTLIAAMESLSRRRRNIVLLAVGVGWLEIIERLRQCGIHVTNVTYAPDEMLPELYNVLDCYWITSRIEGGPLTLLESMSSEVTVVTTPVGMARDIVVDGRNALVAPKDDPDAFCEKTLALVESEELRRNLGKAGRKTVVAGYQWSQYAENIPMLYETALANHASCARTTPTEAERQSVFDSLKDDRNMRAEEEIAWIARMRDDGDIGLALRRQAGLWVRNPLSVQFPPLVSYLRDLAGAALRRHS